MNPFQKNPFTQINNTKIAGNNIHFDEKKKIEKIKENMNRLKYQREEVPDQEKAISTKEKIDILKNLDRWK